MIRYVAPVIGLAVLVGFLYIGLYHDPKIVPSPLIGKPVPQFELPLLQDPAQTLGPQKLLGQVYLLNVWATWCFECRREHEMLMRIAAQNIVPIYGFNLKDDTSEARAWLQSLGNPYVATMVDQDNRAGIDLGVYGAPETFLIDQNGVIIYKLIAPINEQIWRDDFLPRIEQLKGNTQ